MKISEKAKEKIYEEYEAFKNFQYNGKTIKERKELNQFFTPPELSIKLIENLDNISGTVIDPCCGAGNILMAVAIVKVVDLEELPTTVYGYDIDSDMLLLASKRFATYFKIKELHNFIQKDATSYWNSKYNVCITNPPFNKNGASLIELDIIKQIIAYCKKASVLCTVTNITDINGPLKQGKKAIKYKNALNGKLDDICIIENSSKYFSIAIAKDLGILRIVEKTNKNYDDFRFIKNGTNYKFLYDKVYRKVFESSKGISTHWTDCTEPYCVPLKVLVSKNNYNLVTYDEKSKNTKSSYRPSTSIKKCNDKVAKNLVFDTKEEADNFRSTCFTKFYKCLVKCALTSQNIKNINRFIPYMPTYKHPWTDEMLYEYFGLTEDEVKEIEQEVK